MQKRALVFSALLFLLTLAACARAEQRPCPPPQPCPTEISCPKDLPPPMDESMPSAAAPAAPAYRPAPCDPEEDWPAGRGDAGDDYYPGRPLDCPSYAAADVELALARMEEFDHTILEVYPGAWPGRQLLAVDPLDPVDTALHLAGFPNPDGTAPGRVSLFYKNPSEATVIAAQFGLMDDSVRDLEQRVDLRLEEDGWVVEWMGYRQRCARAGSDVWTVELCP